MVEISGLPTNANSHYQRSTKFKVIRLCCYFVTAQTLYVYSLQFYDLLVNRKSMRLQIVLVGMRLKNSIDYHYSYQIADSSLHHGEDIKGPPESCCYYGHIARPWDRVYL